MTDGTTVELDRLIDLRWAARAAGLSMHRGLTGIPGLLKTAIRGQGLEFDDLRPYFEGDDIRYIDWNVTARSGKPHVRLFREERERTITVALDLGSAMFTGTGHLKAVSACYASAAILWHTAHTGGRCGLVIFDGKTLHLSRPTAGERGAIAACARIAEGFDRASVNRRDTSPHDSVAVTRLLDWIVSSGRDAGLSLLVSSMDRPGVEWQLKVTEAARHDRLAILWIRDRTDIDGLPAGEYEYLSATGPNRVSLTHAQTVALRETLREQAHQFEATCRDCRVPLAVHLSGQASDIFTELAHAGT